MENKENQLSFLNYLIAYYGMTYDEYSKEDKYSKLSIKKEYEQYLQGKITF